MSVGSLNDRELLVTPSISNFIRSSLRSLRREHDVVTAAITAGAKRSYHVVRNPDSLVTIENLKALLKISDEGAR